MSWEGQMELRHSLNMEQPLMDNAFKRKFHAARKAGISAELQIFKTGGHGFGVGRNNPQASQWRGLYEEWLKTCFSF